MIPNIYSTPFKIEVNGRIIWNCPSFQMGYITLTQFQLTLLNNLPLGGSGGKPA